MDRSMRGSAAGQKRFGLANALDYLIGEKLLTFAQVAERCAEFSQELPDFLQEIRSVYPPGPFYAYYPGTDDYLWSIRTAFVLAGTCPPSPVPIKLF
jgi:hypothetical protein